jgi:protein gp37/energy-coupling factor transporter ATP-binding protein EcfA2
VIRNPDAACYNLVWNFALGCSHVSRSCKNCCVQELAATYWQYAEKGVTKRTKDSRNVWNNHVWIAAPGDDETWLKPQRFPGSNQFIFVNLFSDAFHKAIPFPIIRCGFWAIASSPHFGMFFTHRYARMAAFIAGASADEERLWKPKVLLGFSVGDQAEFDAAWPIMKPVAERGWRVFASLSPLLEPIVLPDDFLRLACWVNVSAEQGPAEDVRDMDPDWARAVRDQCDHAGIPFFLREMSRNETIPFDLLRHDFPSLRPTINKGLIINIRGTSGAGKTTLARKLMALYSQREPQFIAGRKRPAGFLLSGPGLRPLFVLGDYGEAACGGAYTVADRDQAFDLLTQARDAGHDVLWEGVIYSDEVARTVALCADRPNLIVQLNTPLDICLARVQERRAARGDTRPLNPDNTERRINVIVHARERLTAAGIRVERLSAEEALTVIKQRLNHHHGLAEARPDSNRTTRTGAYVSIEKACSAVNGTDFNA